MPRFARLLYYFGLACLALVLSVALGYLLSLAVDHWIAAWVALGWR